MNTYKHMYINDATITCATWSYPNLEDTNGTVGVRVKVVFKSIISRLANLYLYRLGLKQCHLLRGHRDTMGITEGSLRLILG